MGVSSHWQRFDYHSEGSLPIFGTDSYSKEHKAKKPTQFFLTFHPVWAHFA
ncbi:hypothetical protein LEP1GSC202_0089 [Leptospira yanagawae serovar Saopaulo str. Sao Paulo = ATCC 700523]|uniref:Uncharacterized protein n=1 Tax=Leptospira yanagawae serovar Saopaulo str. Sao Paulo = ATCC 700523 TaxID=1249483 RepID=A0A5E8H6Q3_9LEPT|nr:hypothetical protein LEP1GSC202_0089 [Leptospira yanagawae serovar Saopaulo str. Sao Paulo = ATCC 700523]